jgi:hypothetical protein
MKDCDGHVTVIASCLELVGVPSEIMPFRLVYTELERRVAWQACSAESEGRKIGHEIIILN